MQKLDLSEIERLVAQILSSRPSQWHLLRNETDYTSEIQDAWHIVEFLKWQKWRVEIRIDLDSVEVAANNEDDWRYRVVEPILAGSKVEDAFCLAVCRILLEMNGYSVPEVKSEL